MAISVKKVCWDPEILLPWLRDVILRSIQWAYHLLESGFSVSTVLIARKQRNACSQLTTVLLLCVRWEGETKTWQCKRSSTLCKGTYRWLSRNLSFFQRWSQVVHYFYSKASEQVHSFGFDWCSTCHGKNVVRLTRHNQAVDFFLFSEFILKVQLPRKSKNVKHLVLCRFISTSLPKY